MLLPGIAVSQTRELLNQAIRSGNADKIKAFIEKSPRLLKLPASDRMRPLFAAIQYGQLESVKTLVELGAPTSNKNSRKVSALHWALSRRNEAISRYLIEVMDDVEQTDANQATPLMYAVMHHHNSIEVLEDLLKKGVKLDSQNRRKQTALHVACYSQRVEQASRLVGAGASTNVRDNNQNTPLLIASMRGPRLLQLFLNQDTDISDVNSYGQTALHLACQSGRVESAKLLIGKFSDIDQADAMGLTPLAYAVFANSAEIVDLLLDGGADPDGGASSNSKREQPVIFASRVGNEKMVLRLLDAGANINVVNSSNETCLHVAAMAEGVFFAGNQRQDQRRKRFSSLIATLLKRKANRYSRNRFGKTPLEVAAQQNFFEAVELLIDEKQDLEQFAVESPVHWAAKNGLLKTMNVIFALDQGAVSAVDKDENTPLMVAAGAGQQEAVAWLIERGAGLSEKNKKWHECDSFCGGRRTFRRRSHFIGRGCQFERCRSRRANSPSPSSVERFCWFRRSIDQIFQRPKTKSSVLAQRVHTAPCRCLAGTRRNRQKITSGRI